MSKRFLGACLVWVFVVSGLACVKKAPVVGQWPDFSQAAVNPTQLDPLVLAAAFNHRYPEFQSLSAKVRLEFSKGFKEEIENQNKNAASFPDFEGDLILQKPQAARLRTYTPLGTIAFDFLYQSENVEIYLPQRKELVIVATNDLDELELGGTKLNVPKAEEWWQMLSPWPGFTATPSSTAAAPSSRLQLLPSEHKEWGILKMDETYYQFEWGTGRIRQVQLQRGLHLRYDDWRVNDGSEYPANVHVYFVPPPIEPNTVPPFALQNHSRRFELKLRVAKFQKNPPLDPQAFQGVERSQLKVTHLAKENLSSQ